MTAAITDFNHFSDLRRDAEGNDPAALREVAGQFEALFLQNLLKNMRDASLGESLIGDSHAHEMFEGMLDQQFAMEMASGQGIGLAELLVRQLGGEEAAKLPATQRSNIGLHDLTIHVPVKIGPVTPQAVDKASTASWTNPDSFARTIWPHAKRVAARLNVAPEGVLAQAALETGWGKHVMARADGASSNNLFGIKAGGGWTGDSVARRTLEFDIGGARQELAQFRAYADMVETFDDYERLLTANERYASVRGHGDDVLAFASALQASGYATDPNYAAKITRVANSDTMTRVLADLKGATSEPIAH